MKWKAGNWRSLVPPAPANRGGRSDATSPAARSPMNARPLGSAATGPSAHGSAAAPERTGRGAHRGGARAPARSSVAAAARLPQQGINPPAPDRHADPPAKTRFIFITGGVVSSLGKGIAAASLGRLLVARGLTVG